MFCFIFLKKLGKNREKEENAYLHFNKMIQIVKIWINAGFDGTELQEGREFKRGFFYKGVLTLNVG